MASPLSALHMKASDSCKIQVLRDQHDNISYQQYFTRQVPRKLPRKSLRCYKYVGKRSDMRICRKILLSGNSGQLPKTLNFVIQHMTIWVWFFLRLLRAQLFTIKGGDLNWVLVRVERMSPWKMMKLCLILSFFYKTGWPWRGCRNRSCRTSAGFYYGWCLRKASRRPDRRTF